jgi:hypothetical protein
LRRRRTHQNLFAARPGCHRQGTDLIIHSQPQPVSDPQKPTRKMKPGKSPADFTADADNSRERRHLAGVSATGTINPPAGCRRSQQQPHQFLSARISGIGGSRLPPRLPSVKVTSRPGASAQKGSGKNGWQLQAGPGLA